MTARITIAAPTTITVLAGSGTESSLFNIPPAISIADPATPGNITLHVSAANSAAILSATATAGGLVSGAGHSLIIAGTQVQVNAALATLEDVEPASLTTDNLLLTATDPQALYAQADIGVNIYPTTGPAFVSPPATLSLKANALDAIPLLMGDPEASGLAAIGLGPSDTLTLTIATGTGLLAFGNTLGLTGVQVSGEASGTLYLTFTADALPAADALLNSLEYVGPAGTAKLAYVARNISGPVATTLTYGTIKLTIAGTTTPVSSITTGDETILLGAQNLAGSQAGTTGALGQVNAANLLIAPNAALTLPVSALSLTGSNLDLGSLGAATLAQGGALVASNNFTLAGAVAMAAGAFTDFTGSFIAGNAEATAFLPELSLAAGADIAGGGTLTAGNFSESGMITGPGTITALSGQTLTINAGSVTGGAVLQVAAGAVMVLGPVQPLFGVFAATPVSIDSSVQLNFSGTAAVDQITGIYADTLAQTGGAFVFTGTEAFGGTITGFLPGDKLIFPDLTNANLVSLQGNGIFAVSGQDSSGSIVSYTLATQNPANSIASYYSALDAGGDFEVLVRASAASLNIVSTEAAGSLIPQPILGLSLDLPPPTVRNATLGLRLTLSAAHGVINTGSAAATSQLVLTAASVGAMDALLAGLTYTGSGVADSIAITPGGSASNALYGDVFNAVPIAAASSALVNGYNGSSAAESQIATFAATSGLVRLTQPFTAGRAWVTGDVDFGGEMLANGISGTALLVDAGGTAIFDGSAVGVFSADLMVGDNSGAGTLAIITPSFTTGGNITIGGAAAGSAVEVMGSLGVAGSLVLGTAGLAGLNVAGALSAGAGTLGSAGSLLAYGTAAANFGTLTDAGTITLLNNATASVTSLNLTGTIALGGTSLLDVTGNVWGTNGLLQIGQDASMIANSYTEIVGTILDAGTLAVTGTLNVTNLTLSGGMMSAAVLSMGGDITGYGLVVSADMTGTGLFTANGGVLQIDAALPSGVEVQINTGATLDITSTLASEGIVFNGPSAALVINNPAELLGQVSGLVSSDVIDLRGVAPADVDYLNHLVTVYDTLQNVISNFLIYTNAGEVAPEIVSDGQNGTFLSVGGALPCFARGTRLLTPHGYRPVEQLAPGDPLVTEAGERRAVRWIGRRTLDLGPGGLDEAGPVIISPGAFGAGKPARAVKLSPSHAVYVQGVLVPVQHLVNGATIVRERHVAAVTYYHIELDRHDILLADGLPCESYFDTGNRGALYHERGTRSPARRLFARMVTSGPKLAKIRLRLHEIALAQGFSLTYQPRLRLAAPGVAAVPMVRMVRGKRVAVFSTRLPRGEVMLLSSTATPADTDPYSEDRRALGVCLAGADADSLGAGWLARGPADAGIWMGAQAALHIPAPADGLTLTLAAIVQSWRAPVGVG